LRAFLVAGAFSVMNATPSLIFRSIMGSVSRSGLEQAGGQRSSGGIGHGPIMPRGVTAPSQASPARRLIANASCPHYFLR
jgi:hypothetical protein